MLQTWEYFVCVFLRVTVVLHLQERCDIPVWYTVKATTVHKDNPYTVYDWLCIYIINTVQVLYVY